MEDSPQWPRFSSTSHATAEGRPHVKDTDYFHCVNDQASLDADYPTKSIETFEPIAGRFFIPAHTGCAAYDLNNNDQYLYLLNGSHLSIEL